MCSFACKQWWDIVTLSHSTDNLCLPVVTKLWRPSLSVQYVLHCHVLLVLFKHSYQTISIDAVCVHPTCEHQEMSQYTHMNRYKNKKNAKHSEMHNLHMAAIYTKQCFLYISQHSTLSPWKLASYLSSLFTSNFHSVSGSMILIL